MRTFSRSFHRFSICQLIDDLCPTYNINSVQGPDLPRYPDDKAKRTIP